MDWRNERGIDEEDWNSKEENQLEQFIYIQC